MRLRLSDKMTADKTICPTTELKILLVFSGSSPRNPSKKRNGNIARITTTLRPLAVSASNFLSKR